MEEGKEYMRSFGDLLQFHKKKKDVEDEGETGRGGDGETQ